MNPPILLRQIQFGTDEYQGALWLRDRVLRKPLGLNLFDENLTKEVDDYHIGAFNGDVLIGVLILTVMNDREVKMRQVGVEESWRSKNVGARLVTFAEDFAKERGYRRVVLNARKTVVGFYERLGYEKIGGEFVEVTIPHQRMEKDLM